MRYRAGPAISTSCCAAVVKIGIRLENCQQSHDKSWSFIFFLPRVSLSLSFSLSSYSSFLFPSSLLFSLLRSLFSASFFLSISFHHPILASCRRDFFPPRTILEHAQPTSASNRWSKLKKSARHRSRLNAGRRLVCHPLQDFIYSVVLDDHCGGEKEEEVVYSEPQSEVTIYFGGYCALNKSKFGQMWPLCACTVNYYYYRKSPIPAHTHSVKTTHSRAISLLLLLILFNPFV